VQGILHPASRARIVDVIERLAARGAQGVIAGCTEIEMLVTSDDVTLPYFPTTRLHALAAARWALGESVGDEHPGGGIMTTAAGQGG
jgi:aspartate racemase